MPIEPTVAVATTPEIQAMVGSLRQEHPSYAAMVDRWDRYRAFTGELETVAAKSRWLPKGKVEYQDDYELRLVMSHALVLAQPLVQRMTGTLTKKGAELAWQDSALSEEIRERVEAFREHCDGAGRSIDAWWRDTQDDVLTMGIVIVEVARDAIDPMADGEDPLPFLATWDAEEAINWDVDDRGNLLWVVLRRLVDAQGGWGGHRQTREVIRVLTRTMGFQFDFEPTAGKDAIVAPAMVWEHNLGVVPVVPIYAHRIDIMEGRSYVDAISLADWRAFQLDSDQSWQSYKSAQQILVVHTRKSFGVFPVKDSEGRTIDVEGLGLGNAPVLKLNPGGMGGEREDAGFLGPQVAGLEIRETILERTHRYALLAAGIDPGAVTMGERGGPGQARSGVSIAWAHSTAEEPLLSAFTEQMDAADRQILERVVRYMLPAGQILPPWERVFDGTVKRTAKWDLIDPTTSAELTERAWDLVPVAEFRRAAAKDLARKVLPRAEPEEWARISDAIDQSDRFEPMPMPDLPIQPPEPGDDGDDDGAADRDATMMS